MDLNTEHQSLAEDYHDVCSMWELYSFIDDSEELQRLNEHRGSDLNQNQFNAILREAIRLGREAGREA